MDPKESRLNRPNRLLIAVLLLTGHALAADPYLKVLNRFAGGTDGANPASSLIVDQAGNFYGATEYGGDAGDYGTVFKLAAGPDGVWIQTTLYNFKNNGDGARPTAGLIFGQSGNLYGTTSDSNAGGYGEVFQLAPPAAPGGVWTETVLYSFKGRSDGAYPHGGVLFDDAGNLYGATTSSVFRLSPPAEPGGAWTFSLLHEFECCSGDGWSSQAGLVRDQRGNLYGTTEWGGFENSPDCGSLGCGTVFKVSPPEISGGPWTEEVLYTFLGGDDGFTPLSGLALDQAGNLYGTTYSGGTTGGGTLFRLTPSGSSGQPWSKVILHNFSYRAEDGAAPLASPVLDNAGNVYGTTLFGGNPCVYNTVAYGCGVVYQLTPPAGEPAAWTETLLYRFTTGPIAPKQPGASLILDRKGNLFGTTVYGGYNRCPTDFSEGCGSVFAIIRWRLAASERRWQMVRLMNARLSILFTALAVLPAGTAQTLTTLYAFDGTVTSGDGTEPETALVIGSGGVLYGATASGGAFNYGTVFALSPPNSPGGSWKETQIHVFTGGPDGVKPTALLLGADGLLYGLTAAGGSGCSSGCGTAFSLTPRSWTKQTYEFSRNIVLPSSLSAAGGVLYGDSLLGGTSPCGGYFGCGALFSLIPPTPETTSWTAKVLYSFPDGSGGSRPVMLVLGRDGVFYGASEGGNANCPFGCGLVLSLTPSGNPPAGSWTETVLHSFIDRPYDGDGIAGLVVGGNGVLYGVTNGGGIYGYGAAFSLTPPASPAGSWTEKILYNFAGPYGAAFPNPNLVVGKDGVIYGTSYGILGGGETASGAVFSLTPPSEPDGPWTMTVLHSFTGGADGGNPVGGLVLGDDGVLYGTTTTGGGAGKFGTVFAIATRKDQ